MKQYILLTKSNSATKNFTRSLELAEILATSAIGAELILNQVETFGKFENNEIIVIEDLAHHEKVNTYR